MAAARPRVDLDQLTDETLGVLREVGESAYAAAIDAGWSDRDARRAWWAAVAHHIGAQPPDSWVGPELAGFARGLAAKLDNHLPAGS